MSKYRITTVQVMKDGKPIRDSEKTIIFSLESDDDRSILESFASLMEGPEIDRVKDAVNSIFSSIWNFSDRTRIVTNIESM